MHNRSGRWCLLLLFLPHIVVGDTKLFMKDNIGGSAGEQSVSLTCVSGAKIHLVTIKYRHCEGAKSAYPVCDDRLMVIDELASKCSGLRTCSDHFTVPSEATGFTVYYECVKENLLRMCYDQTLSEDYYNEPINLLYHYVSTVDSKCYCEMKGENMTATAYELHFRRAGGEFTITGDGRVLKPSVYNGLYNDILFSGVRSLETMYYDGGFNYQYAWIHVTGIGEITLKCSWEDSTSTSKLKTTFKTPSFAEMPTTKLFPTAGSTSTTASPSASALETSDDDGVTIGIICGVILFVIVLIIVFVFTTIKCVKRRRAASTVKQDDKSRPPQPPPREPPPLKLTQPQSTQQPTAPPTSEYEGRDYLDLVNTSNTYNQLDPKSSGQEREYTDLDHYDKIAEYRCNYTEPYKKSNQA